MKIHYVIFSFAIFAGTTQLANAQEDGFNFPIVEENSDASKNTSTSGENSGNVYRSSSVDPGKTVAKPKKITEKKSDSSETSKKEEKAVESPTQAPNNTKTASPSDQTEKEEKPKTEKDESVLSFNFLYYMIQKFKFSDVMD